MAESRARRDLRAITYDQETGDCTISVAGLGINAASDEESADVANAHAELGWMPRPSAWLERIGGAKRVA